MSPLISFISPTCRSFSQLHPVWGHLVPFTYEKWHWFLSFCLHMKWCSGGAVWSSWNMSPCSQTADWPGGAWEIFWSHLCRHPNMLEVNRLFSSLSRKGMKEKSPSKSSFWKSKSSKVDCSIYWSSLILFSQSTLFVRRWSCFMV